MKKILFILILVLLPFFATAQKIEYSTVDDFTGKTVIRTDWTNLDGKSPLPISIQNYSGKYFESQFMLRYEEGKIFLHLKWKQGPKKINNGFELQFKLKDGSVITLQAIDDFMNDTYMSVSEGSGNSRNLIDVVYEGSLFGMSDANQVGKLRINTNYGAQVFDIDSRNARRLAKAYKLIQDEIKKSESK